MSLPILSAEHADGQSGCMTVSGSVGRLVKSIPAGSVTSILYNSCDARSTSNVSILKSKTKRISRSTSPFMLVSVIVKSFMARHSWISGPISKAFIAAVAGPNGMGYPLHIPSASRSAVMDTPKGIVKSPYARERSTDAVSGCPCTVSDKSSVSNTKSHTFPFKAKPATILNPASPWLDNFVITSNPSSSVLGHHQLSPDGATHV